MVPTLQLPSHLHPSPSTQLSLSSFETSRILPWQNHHQRPLSPPPRSQPDPPSILYRQLLLPPKVRAYEFPNRGFEKAGIISLSSFLIPSPVLNSSRAALLFGHKIVSDALFSMLTGDRSAWYTRSKNSRVYTNGLRSVVTPFLVVDELSYDP
jgi:hypothetical protein